MANKTTLLRITGKPSHQIALIEGVLTTMMWASSFVLVKLALVHMGPLTIAGLRYFLGFLFLLPLMLRHGSPLRSLSLHLWLRLFLLGLSGYAIANGAFFWGLQYLPATTASFMMSFSPLLALIVGIFWLKEIPRPLQVFGTLVVLTGTGFFFSSGLSGGQPLGLAIVIIGTVSFVIFGMLGREIAKDQKLDTLVLTAIPLGLGGGFMLLIALPLEGLPSLAMEGWIIVLVLALFNTALAYLLYNHALQRLTILEMKVLLNMSPLMTAILAWFFLAEELTMVQILGLFIAVIGVSLVQWKKNHV